MKRNPKNSLSGPLMRMINETPLFESRTLSAHAAYLAEINQNMQAPDFIKNTIAMFDPSYEVDESGVAVMSVNGSLIYRPEIFELYYYGAEDTEKLTELVYKAASDSSVKSLVIDFNSPGGYSMGVSEFGDAVKALAKVKPVVSYTGGMMASAAYWAGSQATEIVSAKSSIVGSIGVYAAIYDYAEYFARIGIKVNVVKNKEAKFKAAGLPGTQLTEDQRNNIQSSVQHTFEQFKKAVKAKRTISAEVMQGQTFSGEQAANNGLVDHTGTLNFAKLRARRLSR